jgi:adenylate kinase family enzyme
MRLAIVGNSGSGKSTLARWAARTFSAAHLDLDTVAWEPEAIAVPRKPAAAKADVAAFCASRKHWVVEGCYASLVAASLLHDARLLLLHPGEEQCLANCRARPWEPHKYASPAEQLEQLGFLLDWVRAYESRQDELSLSAHRALFEEFNGPKLELRQQPCLDPPSSELLGWLH